MKTKILLEWRGKRPPIKYLLEFSPISTDFHLPVCRPQIISVNKALRQCQLENLPKVILSLICRKIHFLCDANVIPAQFPWQKLFRVCRKVLHACGTSITWSGAPGWVPSVAHEKQFLMCCSTDSGWGWSKRSFSFWRNYRRQCSGNCSNFVCSSKWVFRILGWSLAVVGRGSSYNFAWNGLENETCDVSAGFSMEQLRTHECLINRFFKFQKLYLERFGKWNTQRFNCFHHGTVEND